MNGKKGLPGYDQVKAMLDWEVWNMGGQFNIGAVPRLFSMHNGRGLPTGGCESDIGLAGLVPDDQFNMELFRAFSSMHNGRGLPNRRM